MDLDFIDEIIHRVLALSKRLDDPQTHGVSQSLKDIEMHRYVYILLCISTVKRSSDAGCPAPRHLSRWNDGYL
jgi:hypothetical protein